MKNKLLIVDDEESIRKLLAARFDREGWEVICAENGKDGVKAALTSKPDVIITDVKMPGLDGFQMIEALRSAQVLSPIIVITGHGEKECAIESLHKGAFDYMEKPFDMNEISHTIKRALQHEQLRTQNIALMKKLETDLEVKSTLLEKSERDHVAEEILVGKSSHIENLKETIRTISDSFGGDHEPVVLITGESGVGKEVVARFIHASIHPKDYKNKPFVAINCAAFPENLLESELFGYEKGAFTGAQSRKLGLFELANGGTLFLDEIGDMDLKMQIPICFVTIVFFRVMTCRANHTTFATKMPDRKTQFRCGAQCFKQINFDAIGCKYIGSDFSK
jgi:DNA-binding NtrC family response regulator